MIIINFVYASFSISNQGHQFSFTSPLTLLQYVCLLLSTVLFQPLLEMLLSMVSCVTTVVTLNANGDSASTVLIQAGSTTSQTFTTQNILVLSMFNNVQCFQGAHILHGIIAIVVSLVLTTLTILIVFLYFESRKHSTIILSK